jgi:hypothetical protein
MAQAADLDCSPPKEMKVATLVTPAKVGVHFSARKVDSRFRGDDGGGSEVPIKARYFLLWCISKSTTMQTGNIGNVSWICALRFL